MLGTEPLVIEEYVQSGQAKIIFWPVLNHGDPSVYSTLTAECVGQQNPDTFWEVHEQLFTNQSDLWRADRDYFVQTAVSVGADQATFEACYDGAAGVATVMELDNLRRQRGIYTQPMFDINGQIFGGAPSFDTFSLVLNDLLN